MQSLGKSFTEHGFPFGRLPQRADSEVEIYTGFQGAVLADTPVRVGPVQRLSCDAVMTEASSNAVGHPGAGMSFRVARIKAKGPGF